MFRQSFAMQIYCSLKLQSQLIVCGLPVYFEQHIGLALGNLLEIKCNCSNEAAMAKKIPSQNLVRQQHQQHWYQMAHS